MVLQRINDHHSRRNVSHRSENLHPNPTKFFHFIRTPICSISSGYAIQNRSELDKRGYRLSHSILVWNLADGQVYALDRQQDMSDVTLRRAAAANLKNLQ